MSCRMGAALRVRQVAGAALQALDHDRGLEHSCTIANADYVVKIAVRRLATEMVSRGRAMLLTATMAVHATIARTPIFHVSGSPRLR